MTETVSGLLLDAVSSSILISPICSCASTAVPGDYNISSFSQSSPIYHYPSFNMTDLETSRNAYNTLLQSAKSYRHALASMSISAGNLGSALEACARLKEARSEAINDLSANSMNILWHDEDAFKERGKKCTADNLLAASGVHQLIANFHQILSDTIYQNLEVSLMHELDRWQSSVEKEEAKYHRETKVIVKEIHSIEKNGFKLRKPRKKELSQFREHLTQLTQKTNALTELSGNHGRFIARVCHEISHAILECSATVVRAEVEVFQTLARKGWSGAGLDELMQKGRDIFSSEDGKEERSDNLSSSSRHSSICDLQHMESGSSDKKQQKRIGLRDSLVLETMGYQPNVAEAGPARESGIISIFSESDNAAKCNSNSTRIPRLNSLTLLERAKVTKDSGHDKKTLKIGKTISDTTLEVIPDKTTRSIEDSIKSSLSFIRDKNDPED